MAKRKLCGVGVAVGLALAVVVLPYDGRAESRTAGAGVDRARMGQLLQAVRTGSGEIKVPLTAGTHRLPIVRGSKPVHVRVAPGTVASVVAKIDPRGKQMSSTELRFNKPLRVERNGMATFNGLRRAGGVSPGLLGRVGSLVDPKVDVKGLTVTTGRGQGGKAQATVCWDVACLGRRVPLGGTTLPTSQVSPELVPSVLGMVNGKLASGQLSARLDGPSGEIDLSTNFKARLGADRSLQLDQVRVQLNGGGIEGDLSLSGRLRLTGQGR
jgi:hypothetical protein